MDDAPLARLLLADAQRRRSAQQFRQRRIVSPQDSAHVELEGRTYVNFASNDYLGLTHHPRVIGAAAATLSAQGLGSGAAALITGYTPAHASAERVIAAWKGMAGCVLLPSGYQANLAAVQTLAAVSNDVRFLVDKLVHASLLDAVAVTGKPMRVFPHNHLTKLERLLCEAPAEQLQVVITESIFSMDGDAADLRGLAALKAKYPFALLLDEAHASGVYGPDGSGYAAEMGLTALADVSVVTLSKALGAVGGAVCGSADFCAAVVNAGRAYIFSTSLPAAVVAAAQAAIGVLRDEPQRQTRLRELARRVRAGVTAAGFELPAGDSPIIPVILGSEERALAAAEFLRERGLLVPAIRPPSVPPGSSRLRVTVSSNHTNAQIEQLLLALGQLPS